MEYIAAFFAWLQKLFAETVFGAVIILFLAILFAAITNDWLHEKYYNVNPVLLKNGITDSEYWMLLIGGYGLFFLAIKIVESLIAMVFLLNSKKE